MLYAARKTGPKEREVAKCSLGRRCPAGASFCSNAVSDHCTCALYLWSYSAIGAHSSRREFIGSIREARRGGRNPAIPATKASIAALPESVQGSLALTPYRKLAMERVAPTV